MRKIRPHFLKNNILSMRADQTNNQLLAFLDNQVSEGKTKFHHCSFELRSRKLLLDPLMEWLKLFVVNLKEFENLDVFLGSFWRFRAITNWKKWKRNLCTNGIVLCLEQGFSTNNREDCHHPVYEPRCFTTITNIQNF